MATKLCRLIKVTGVTWKGGACINGRVDEKFESIKKDDAVVGKCLPNGWEVSRVDVPLPFSIEGIFPPAVLRIKDNGLTALSPVIAETNITPRILRNPGRGFTHLVFKSEEDRDLMRKKLSDWIVK